MEGSDSAKRVNTAGAGTDGKHRRGLPGAGDCGRAGVCLPDKWLFNVRQEKGSLQTNTICLGPFSL